MKKYIYWYYKDENLFFFGWKKSKRNVVIGENATQWETVKFTAIIQRKWGRDSFV